jgi:undecaprenyl-diphosphatase
VPIDDPMSSTPNHMLASIRDRLAAIRRLNRDEVFLLGITLFVLVLAYAFIRLADEVKEGGTQTFDERVLRSLRRPDDPAIPVGPPWVRQVVLDVTALGGPVVLGLVAAAVVGFMVIRRQSGLALFTVMAIVGGGLLSALLKELVNRDRPSVVPHLREVSSASFPSGHALVSAVVYLTLGTLLCRIVPGRPAKWYCLGWAMVLTFLVGISRIYLGVHYPTDVLAGWMAGLVWALGCWAVAQYLRLRRGRMSRSDVSGASPPEASRG